MAHTGTAIQAAGSASESLKELDMHLSATTDSLLQLFLRLERLQTLTLRALVEGSLPALVGQPLEAQPGPALGSNMQPPLLTDEAMCVLNHIQSCAFVRNPSALADCILASLLKQGAVGTGGKTHARNADALIATASASSAVPRHAVTQLPRWVYVELLSLLPGVVLMALREESNYSEGADTHFPNRSGPALSGASREGQYVDRLVRVMDAQPGLL